MEENKNLSQNTPISGFDEVTGVSKEEKFNPTPMFSGLVGNKKESFTVTPEGSFYSSEEKPAEPSNSAAESVAEETALKKEEPAEVEKTSPVVEDVGAENSSQTAPETAELGEEKATEPVAEPQKPETPLYIPNGTYSYSKETLPFKEEPAPQNPQYARESAPTPPPASNYQNFGGFSDDFIPSKQKAKKVKSKKYGIGTVVTAVVLSVLLSVGGTFGLLWVNSKYGFLPQSSETETETINNHENVITQEVTNITVEDETVYSIVQAVAEKSGPSVIGIRTTAAVSNFFGGQSETTEEGSGIIYTVDGYIITNYHVIQSAVESSNSKVEVFLPEDTTTAIAATVVGYNISSDLAVVKIDKTGLPAIEFADSDEITVGQYAIAIGNPGGLEFMGSVSCGIISGLNRSVAVGTGGTMSLIQTDAAINPGNSGGALVDKNGKLIGVNSAKLVSESYEGMGFAIPSNTVKEICDNIINKQNSPTPYIGIQISQSYTADQLKAFGMPAGAVVLSVVEGGPASDSGLQRGDIITEFNGVEISSYTDLDSAISDCTPGTSVTVKLYRNGRSYSTNINVEANNAQ